jgi:[ribosomal protein S18]-alanine N-acetyltransferase
MQGLRRRQPAVAVAPAGSHPGARRIVWHRIHGRKQQVSTHLFSRRGASQRRPAGAPKRSPKPTPGLRLRRAGIADIDALDALEQAAFSGDRMRRRQFLHHVQAPSSDLIVAMSQQRLLGYALLLRRRGIRSCRVYSIAVSPEARGQGLGAVLLERLERIARIHGLSEIRLEVRQDNATALALYESRGYQRFDARSGYYEDGADAWRLAKSLSPKPRRRSSRSG